MVGLAPPRAYNLRTNKPYSGGPLDSAICNAIAPRVCLELPFAHTLQTDKSFLGRPQDSANCNMMDSSVCWVLPKAHTLKTSTDLYYLRDIMASDQFPIGVRGFRRRTAVPGTPPTTDGKLRRVLREVQGYFHLSLEGYKSLLSSACFFFGRCSKAASREEGPPKKAGPPEAIVSPPPTKK